jgi:hypothetical protein
MSCPSERLPCLAAGRGLPGRQIALCDGRTSLRLVQQGDGMDLLTHYAADSWFGLARVLVAAGTVMRWDADGTPHRFDWTEVYPFGYRNREERPDGPVTSECVVEQGAVQWSFRGLREAAVLTIPRSMFAEKNERDRTGEPLQVCVWAFPEADGGGARTWQAVRREQWLFRDSSTYAGIEGRTVPSEPHTSELHLCVAGSGDFTVTHDAAAWRVRVTADAGGRAALVIGLGSTLAEAEEAASSRLRRPAAAAQRQGARYRAVAESTPTLDFGRHTALQRFSGSRRCIWRACASPGSRAHSAPTTTTTGYGAGT